MRNHWIALGAVAIVTLAPPRADAFELVGTRLEIYGKANISAEYQDSDTNRSTAAGTRGRTTDGGEFGVSSNSSRFGIKGVIPLGTTPALSALYQFEQEINVDRGGGDTLGTRNSFIGLGSPWGDIMFGYYDTAFKMIGDSFTIWGDTVADRRTILGASPVSGNRMDVRYRNMAMYRFKSDNLQLVAQYSADTQNGAGVPDLNSNDSFSIGGEYKAGIFSVGAALERDSHDLAAAGGSPALFDGGPSIPSVRADSTWGLRVGGGLKFSAVKISAIYEHISTGDRVTTVGGRPTGVVGTLDRDAFGGSILYYVTPQVSIGGQILHATKVANTSGTQATTYSAGVWYDATKWAAFYLIGSMTDNGRNARYAVADGGHGDRVSTAFGRDPRIVSAGMMFSF